MSAGEHCWARGITTTYGYDNDGEIESISYSDDTPSVSYDYDRRGLIRRVADRGTRTLTYNDAGLPLTDDYWVETSQFGSQSRYGYDSLLRRTNLTNLALGSAVNYGYDAASRLQTVSSPSTLAGEPLNVTYTYLADSPLVSQILFQQNGATRMTTTKEYDHLNRLGSISSLPSAGSAISFRYGYNDANQRTTVTNAESARWNYQYDALGQVTSGKRSWSDGTLVAGQQFEYVFDDIGNRKSTKQGGDDAGANLRSNSYTPNLLNQYSSRTNPPYVEVQGAADASATVTVNEQSAYRKGEYYRVELGITNDSGAVYLGITNQAELSANTVKLPRHALVAKTPEAFTYDNDGNLSTDGKWTYTWDGENRLMSMESASGIPAEAKRRLEFLYDQQSRRISKKYLVWNPAESRYQMATEERYWYDGWNLIGRSELATRRVQTYLWGLDLSGSLQGAGGVGGLLAMSDSLGTNYFYAYDGNGNVMALINATDSMTASRYEYGPFGEVIRATGPMAKANPFRFSTQYTDDETDLVHYLYRVYNPSTGRWLSRDPIGEEGGLNLMAFVANDGVNQFDYLGLSGSIPATPGAPSSPRRPIRPDNRDRPQRRPERRTQPRDSHGDAKCTRCGPEVSAGLAATMNAVKTRFDALSDDEKAKRCALSHLFGTWDIVFPSPPAGCGEGACSDTVMVSGKCYDKWKVNYILFGRISSLCDFWRIKMEALVAGQKLIRKPLVDGDWENEYTGDVRGFMRIGYNWDGSLPSSLPGPTGGFGGCKPCDKAGASDPKYSSAFSTTWP